ncbi:MAG: S41 family peptidase [Bacteroidota bacterium]
MRAVSRPRPLHFLALALALGVGALLGTGFAYGDDFFAMKKNFTIFGELYEELATGYVDPVDPERMMRAGIEAMLGTLDPYTVFIDEAANEDIDIVTRGRYGGVGVTVSLRGERFTVVEVVEGYSAAEVGMRPGDTILSVDGTPVSEFAQDDLRALLRGTPGTTVDLSVEREGEPGALAFTLTRAEIQLKNVTHSGFLGGEAAGVGYVRLERFARTAASEVEDAVATMQAEADETGRTLTGLVLDLRGNRGGLLDQAVDIVGHFVPQGSVVVSTRGRAAESERVYRSEAAPIAPDMPLVVLVDGVSASASEIVAGALQDHDRAVVLGETTFGKGLVQIIRPLPYNTSLKMTTSKYYIPSGRSIQSVTYWRDEAGGHADEVPDSLRRAFETLGGRTVFDGQGINPDIEASLGPVSELEEALVRRAAFFRFANRFAAETPTLPTGFAVDDALLARFRAFVDAEDIAYETRAERMLAELVADLDEAGYDATDDEVADLRAELVDEKEADFERHAPRLRERLRQEILSRYVGQPAQVATSLGTDPQLRQAVAVLDDRARYRSVLAPR